MTNFVPDEWKGESLTHRLLICWELGRTCAECAVKCPLAERRQPINPERKPTNAE